VAGTNKNSKTMVQADEYDPDEVDEALSGDDDEGGGRSSFLSARGAKYIGIVVVVVIIAVVVGLIMNNRSNNPPNVSDILGDSFDPWSFDPLRDPLMQPPNQDPLMNPGMATPVPTPTPTPEPTPTPGPQFTMGEDWYNAFMYYHGVHFTQEQIERLIFLGFSSHDIQNAVEEETPYDDLIAYVIAQRTVVATQMARDLYWTLRQEAVDTVEGYQNLVWNTWMGGAPIEQVDISQGQQMYHNRVENVRFTKVPPHGHQLYLRLVLQEGQERGQVVFMTVTPERWDRLRDEGNIVVQLQFVEYAGTRYYVRITEINVD
jgi:hypothetical protein